MMTRQSSNDLTNRALGLPPLQVLLDPKVSTIVFAMPRRSSLQAVLLYNRTNDNNEFIPVRVEIGSWVTLLPGKKGGHAKDAAKHGSTSFEGAYKARVQGFRMEKRTVSEILVQHAYMYRQLDLDRSKPLLITAACNYLYLSASVNWIDPKSILDLIVVQHAEIGEVGRGSRSHKDLLHDGIFFYNAMYVPKRKNGAFGSLEPIPLPAFDDPAWPIPDMASSEAFRAKLRLDFQTSMKPTTGSKSTHLQWFMPIGIMVDLFAAGFDCMHKTPTMFVWRSLSKPLIESLMDSGWDEKVTIGLDAIRCIVDQKSLSFRYHIARSILYANFQFNRQRNMGGSNWEYIDQCEEISMVEIHCQMDDWKEIIEVGQMWNISSIRQEILIAMGSRVPENFTLWIIEDNVPKLKINPRNEEKMIAAEVVFPKMLQIIDNN